MPHATDFIRLGDAGYVVATLNAPAAGKGHDRLLVQDGFAGVADGSTPLGPELTDPGDFAELALIALQRAGTANDGTNRVWDRAIRNAAAEVNDRNVSCAVAAIRTRGNDLEGAVLGDCLALIVTTSGTLVRLFDEAVVRLDRTAALARDPQVLLANRALMNTPEGYWIFASDPNAARHVQSARVSLRDVVSVLLCTDGLLHQGDIDHLSQPPTADDTTAVLLRRSGVA